MILTNVAVYCDKHNSSGVSLNGPSCSVGPIGFDHNPTEAALTEALTAAGYVTRDGKHLCQYHAESGDPLTLAGDWWEIAPGVKVRAPMAWQSIVIEVKRVATDG